VERGKRGRRYEHSNSVPDTEPGGTKPHGRGAVVPHVDKQMMPIHRLDCELCGSACVGPLLDEREQENQEEVDDDDDD
jgi:hypothetical protein